MNLKMNSSLFTSVLLILSSYCFTWTEGLDCYTCAHVEGTNLDVKGVKEFFHSSCKSGGTPHSGLLQTCGTLFPDKHYSCGKFYFETDIDTPSTSTRVKVTLRSCIASDTKLNDTCGEHRVEDLLERLPPGTIPPEAEELVEALKGINNATVCSCDTNRCNSSSKVTITSGMFMLSLGFLAVTLVGSWNKLFE